MAGTTNDNTTTSFPDTPSNNTTNISPPSTNTTNTTTTTTTTNIPKPMDGVNDFQNDYSEDRSSSSSTRPRSQSDNLYPEVIVSPERPTHHHDLRPHHVQPPDPRELGEEGDFHRVPSVPALVVGNVTVRVEEICLVLVVLMLWAGAITLFINRWGKLRMLEPYQPAYTAPPVPPRPPPPPLGPCINIQSTSDLTLTDTGAPGSRYDWGSPEHYGRGSLAGGYLGMARSPSSLSIRTLNPQRKVKSAVDLVSLVMQEKMSSNYHLATNV